MVRVQLHLERCVRSGTTLPWFRIAFRVNVIANTRSFFFEFQSQVNVNIINYLKPMKNL